MFFIVMIQFNFEATMCNTLSFFLSSLVIILFCNEASGSVVFLQYKMHGNYSKVFGDTDTLTIEYKEGDEVEIICSYAIDAIQNGNNPTMFWIDGGKKSDPVLVQSIHRIKKLSKDDDGTELECKVLAADQKQTWGKSAYFVLFKLTKPTNVFLILLIGAGGLILAAIVLLITYGLIQRCRNKKRNTDGTDGDATENQEQCEIMKRQERSVPTPNQEETDLGIVNLSCNSNTPSYVKFDSPDRKDICEQITNAINNRNENGGRISARNLSSSEC